MRRTKKGSHSPDGGDEETVASWVVGTHRGSILREMKQESRRARGLRISVGLRTGPLEAVAQAGPEGDGLQWKRAFCSL